MKQKFIYFSTVQREFSNHLVEDVQNGGQTRYFSGFTKYQRRFPPSHAEMAESLKMWKGE